MAVSSPRVQDGVANVFNEASGYYRDLRWEKNRLTRFEKMLTQTVIEEELGDRHVESALEVGCGPGTWTGLLAARADRVTDVDLSEQMLQQARSFVDAANVEFIHGDAARFAIDRRFDLAMSIRVLEYVPEWREVVHRLGELVNPGGRVLVITKTPLSAWRGTGRERWFGPHTLGRRLTGRTLNPDFWQRHIRVRDLRAAFGEAGLGEVRVRPVIFGLPIFVRGTKQYPLVPEFAEPPVLSAAEGTWRLASARGPGTRWAVLPLSESYAVSGVRR
jgi:ubiquinone/menaquinone biosynthesis C-methylase UbiE